MPSFYKEQDSLLETIFIKGVGDVPLVEFLYSGTCNSVRLKIRLPHQDGGHDFMRGQSYRLIQGVVSFHIPGNLQTIISYVLSPNLLPSKIKCLMSTNHHIT